MLGIAPGRLILAVAVQPASVKLGYSVISGQSKAEHTGAPLHHL